MFSDYITLVMKKYERCPFCLEARKQTAKVIVIDIAALSEYETFSCTKH